MSIIDRRKNGPGKSAPNRRKFIERYKKQIKKAIDKNVKNRSIKDANRGIDIGIDGDTTREPDYHYDPRSGNKRSVSSGNDTFSKGDRLPKPRGGQGRGSQGSPDGSGEDDFTFTLTKEEFFELYFDDMELPDFIKESIKGDDSFKFRRAGYTIDGTPMRLNARKTMENAIARRLASKAQLKELGSDKKPPYLDDLDLRYDRITKVPLPIMKAVMFCVMDVSGSMREQDKALAKKFYILLYLFLTKCYDTVEVRFIKYTHEASEVSEEEFFYSTDNGGTVASTAFELILEIINKEIDLSTTNIYISQASDGDDWGTDIPTLMELLEKDILPKVQYMTYIQTRPPETSPMNFYMGIADLYSAYHILAEKVNNLKAKLALEDKDIYKVLRELFERAKT